MRVTYDENLNLFKESKNKNDVMIPQVVWHITSKCKLNCKFCFNSVREDNYNIDEIIDFLKQYNVLKVDISGGEPLLSNNFIDICERLIKEQISMTVTTTGYGDKENFEWLLNNTDKFSRIIFSLDGNEEVHNKIRRNDNIFGITIEKIKKISVFCKNIRINTVISKSLKDKDMNELISIVEELNPREWCLIQMHPANDKGEYDNISVVDEFDDTIKKIKEIYSNEIIIRKIDNYTGYIVIYSDSTISMHSNIKEDEFNIELNDKNLKEIIKMKDQSIPNVEKIVIENIDNNENISYFLNQIKILCDKKEIEYDLDIKSEENKKNEIVNGIIINLASSAIIEIIKFAFNKLKNRKGYDKADRLKIDNVDIKIEELENELDN